MPLTFSPLKDGDYIKQVLEIEQDSFVSPWNKEMFLSSINDEFSQLYVLLEGKNVIAYGGYKFFEESSDILNICVKREFRRQGIGCRFLEYIIEKIKLKNIKKIMIEVRKDNNAAINLYKLYGFKIISQRKNYYKDCDALIMILEL